MSQAGILDVIANNPQVPVQFDTDSGNAIPVGNVLEILGDATQGSTTSGSGNTVTITNTNASTSQIGVQRDSTDAETIAGSLSNVTVVPSSLKSKLGLQTANSIPYGLGDSSAIGWSSALNDGEILIGQTGGIPVAGTLLAGAGISITEGPNSIEIAMIGGSTGIDSISPDSGTDPVVPDGAGLVTIIGDGSTTTVGGTNSLSVQLTGLTNHAVLVGAGTTTITKVGPTATAGQVLQSAGASADPAFSTATYPLTSTINEILFSSATNTITGLATANSAVLTTTATGVPVQTALAIDGQLIIGSTAGAPAAATLTAGTGITITNASNSITINGTASVPLSFPTDSGTATPAANALTISGSGGIATSGSGAIVTIDGSAFQQFAWTEVTGTSQAIAVDNGYIANNAGLVTLTIPSSASVGDRFIVQGKGAGLFKIGQNASQTIHFLATDTTTGTGGSLTAIQQYASIEILCITNNTDFAVLNSSGSFTIV